MNTRTIVTTIAALLLLAACSGDEPEAAPLPTLDPVTSPASPEPTAVATTPALNARGNIPKAIGEQAWFLDADGDTFMTYRVTDVTVTTEPVTDDEFAEPSENGYFVVVTIEGETTETFDSDEVFWFGWNHSDFILLTTDGTRVNAPDTLAAFTALDEADSLPQEVGPSQRFTGKLALDSPVDHGFLIYSPDGSGQGHEWEF